MFRNSGKKPHRFGSPIDRKAHALRETEEKLRRDKERLERLLKEAPRLKEEREKRRREEFANDPRFTRTSVMDQHVYRISATANPGFGQRRLRSEKRDGLWLFLVLVGMLASVVFWICHLLM
jgi:hypothetical protein